MEYISEFKDLFETCLKQEREWKIRIYQGSDYSTYRPIVDFFRNSKNANTNDYLTKVSHLVERGDFQNQIVELKKNNIQRENKLLIKRLEKVLDDSSVPKSNEKQLEILDWVELKKNYECISSVQCLDWKIILLEDLYEEYIKYRNNSNKYEYSSDNPLSKFYKGKGIDRYGLFPVSGGFLIKANGIPKIYDTKNDTHIIIRFVPNDFVKFLKKLKSNYCFDIAFRPDYELIGEHIKDLSPIFDSVSCWGKTFETYISQLPSLSGMDDFESGSHLIIKKEGNTDLTFEELIDDFEIYEDYIVTQVVHLQYINNQGKEYVTHIDHEYVFYNIDDYDKKLKNKLTTKGGESRQSKEYPKKIKTFKIDNAKIEFTRDADSNIVFQTLKAFFQNDVLINEYFERLYKNE